MWPRLTPSSGNLRREHPLGPAQDRPVTAEHHHQLDAVSASLTGLGNGVTACGEPRIRWPRSSAGRAATMPAALRPSTSRVAARPPPDGPCGSALPPGTRVRPLRRHAGSVTGAARKAGEWRPRSAKNSWLPAGPSTRLGTVASSRQPHRRASATTWSIAWLAAGRLADHAALAELLAADFELRLDHQQQLPRRRGHGGEPLDQQDQRDEGHVGHHQVDRLAVDMVEVKLAEVGPLAEPDPGVARAARARAGRCRRRSRSPVGSRARAAPG